MRALASSGFCQPPAAGPSEGSGGEANSARQHPLLDEEAGIWHPEPGTMRRAKCRPRY